MKTEIEGVKYFPSKLSLVMKQKFGPTFPGLGFSLFTSYSTVLSWEIHIQMITVQFGMYYIMEII